MAFIAPLFSRRARERRAARAALRAELPGAFVALVVPYPLPDPSLISVLLFETKDAVTHRYLGVHGSGTFALSPSQLRRMVRRIEGMRPA